MAKSKQNLQQLLILVCLGLCLGIYLPSIDNPFSQLDDFEQLVTNTQIQQFDLPAIFSSTSVGMYQPVSSLFYALVYAFAGLSPASFHLLSLLFHLLNGLLVWFLFRQLNYNSNVSLFALACFLLHPLQVESVAWISAFSTLCSTFFFLLSLLGYIHFKKKHKQNYLAWSILAFAFACLSKSAAIVLPLFLLGLDYFYFSEKKWKSQLNKIPYFLISFLFGLITLFTRETAGHLSDLSSDFNWLDRFFLVAYNLWFYLIKAAMPFQHSIYYPFPEPDGAFLDWSFYAAGIGLIAAILLVWKFKFSKMARLGLLFYFAGLILVIQLIPLGNQLSCERYFYLPFIGLLLIIGSFIQQKQALNRQLIWLLIPFCWSALSLQAAKRWDSDEGLWKEVLEQYPHAAQAHNNLGSIELSKQNLSLALDHFNQAIQHKPSYADAYSNRGSVLAQLGKSENAIRDFNQALALRPHADAYFNRANEKVKKGELNEALQDYTESLKLKPSADAYTNRSYAYAQQKRFGQAEQDLKSALQLNPEFAQAYFLQGLVFRAQSRMQEACISFQKAVKLKHEQASKALKQFCS